MAGQDMSDVDAGVQPPTGSSDELMSKPRWQRAVISFAGPAVNLIFPVIASFVLFVAVGMPHPGYLDEPVKVVALSSKPDAQPSPFQPGDKVLSLNGIANPDVGASLQSNQRICCREPRITAEVENNGVRRTVEVKIANPLTADPLGYAPVLPVLDEVAANSPAYQAGLKENDVIQAVDGQKIQYWGQFVDRVRGSDGKSIQLDLQRNGQPVHTEVKPIAGATESGEKIYQVGVAVRDHTKYRREGIGEGLARCIRQHRRSHR